MSDPVLDGILTDLAAEGDALEALVAPLDEAGWRTPTPAEGWDVATTIAHLAWTDEVAVKAATDKEAWDAEVMGAIMNPTGYVDECAVAGAAVAPAELLARWQAARPALAKTLAEFPSGEKLMWFGPPMSPASMASARFMETWAHALDVADALGVAPEPTDRIRHVAHIGVRTRNYSFKNNELEAPAEEFRVELTAPSGEVWTYGPADAAQTVTGSALDFCRLVTQRVHRDDTDLVAVGDDAEKWLTIAQAFAGPAGGGRPARGAVA
ncbi:TIGR03084 family metal-binding protein [Nocardioides jishulii]|uniref:TIGR03084 family protein n=1 Tax=Nocardioides jishulii TaxID=2575440 RepID=A0A4U2YRC4_9ACTN|nr:TIGR03084 family metal-binding protein [Nocardioides jishulii]QCX26229.1 TIGR03084 family protein [Nocardioides jishulii]TKI63967.1 TIGR03084 family protein [Nocardioides jishulii]